MTKHTITKKASFSKSIINRLRRRKIYIARLEADFAHMRNENEMLKKSILQIVNN